MAEYQVLNNKGEVVSVIIADKEFMESHYSKGSYVEVLSIKQEEFPIETPDSIMETLRRIEDKLDKLLGDSKCPT